MKIEKSQDVYVSSECPLARDHIIQGITISNPGIAEKLKNASHPVQILALAYGLQNK